MTPADRLPIAAVLTDVRTALERKGVGVLIAPPGAGKTTGVPLALLDAGWLAGRRIVLLEPRRLAARAAAERMAGLLGEGVGDTVGLRARLDTRIGPRTRIEVVTEGVFTRMILDDPTLDGVGAVLFDEFHERSLDADLGLALALDCRAGLRDDLRLLVMSATLDAAPVARLLDGAPVIACDGRTYPIETRYLGRAPDRRIEDQVADAVLKAHREERGSILVFLPGQSEIRRTAERLLEQIASPDTTIVELHGGLDGRRQADAIRPAAAGRRKIVLATSIAQTSLTIEGVRVVVDCGLERLPRYEPGAGITRLETVRASRATVDQRRGRAGRTEPGVCYRLWDEPETTGLAPFSPPEIRTADLGPLLLDCALWGVTDPQSLKWLDPPGSGAVAAARAELRSLGAIDDRHALTESGRRLRALPLPPRLAHMVLAAADRGQARMAAEIAAVLVERGLGGSSIDLDERIAAFRRDMGPRAESMRRLARGWARTAEALVPGAPRPTPPLATADVLALAYPERVAVARGSTGEFLLASGRRAAVDTASPLSRAPGLVVAELSGAAVSARVLCAARLEARDLERIAGARVTDCEEITFDTASRAVRARRVRRLGAITLASEPIPVPRTPETAALLARSVAAQGIAGLPWSKAQRQLRDRVAFLRAAEGAATALPDLSDTALAASVEAWLAPFLIGATRADEIGPDTLERALSALLPFNLRQRLEAEVPTHYSAPSGNRHPIVYEGDDAPRVEIRVQELFGLKEHPAVANGRLPLTLHLLSPAHRLIQITRDLPGFWAGSWRDVRAEMRGRYPKHPWPDDPANALATARAKPRK
jgi:ATP-dependent helicase HrpB